MDLLSLLISTIVRSIKSCFLKSPALNSLHKVLGGKPRSIILPLRVWLAAVLTLGQVSCSFIDSAQTDPSLATTPNSAESISTQPLDQSLNPEEQDFSWLSGQIKGGLLPSLTAQLSEIKGLFKVGHGSHALLLSVDRTGLVALLDPKTDRSYELFRLKREVGSLVYQQSSGRLAISTGPVVKVFQLDGLKLLTELPRLKARATALVFSPDGQSLIIGGSDGRIYRWRYLQNYHDLDKNDQALNLEVYFGLSSPVSSLDVHPSGRVFFSADWTGGLSGWLTYDSDKFSGEFDQNLLEGSMFGQRAARMRTARDGPTQIEKFQLIDRGQFILAGTSVGAVELWRARGLVSLGTTNAHEGIIHALAFDQESHRVATSARDGRVRVWELTADPEVFDKPQTFSLKLLREFDTGIVKSLVFFSENVVYAGKSSGEILRLDL